MIGTAIALVCAAAILLLPTPCIAQDQDAPIGAPSDQNPTDAAGFLERMASAENATYQLRQLVVYFGVPQSAAVIDVRSSGEGHFLRAESGPAVTRLWRRPDLRVVSDGDGSIADAAPPPVELQPAAILLKYDVELGRPVSLLGVPVVPLAFVRRSDRAAVERLWVHPSSGVVYRRELYGLDGGLLALTAILDMRWGKDMPAETYDPGPGEMTRARGASAADAPTMLSNGYRLLRGYRIRMHGRATEHWLYTDGLHALSVFRTFGGMRRPAGFAPVDVGGATGWVGPGPGTWAWEGDGASWVVVAEEPALDPVRLTERLPKGGPTVWARLGSVWSRAFRAIGGLVS